MPFRMQTFFSSPVSNISVPMASVLYSFFECLLVVALLNTRSHGSLLTIPNKLFYESELQVGADMDIRNSLCEWKHLPSKVRTVHTHGRTSGS